MRSLISLFQFQIGGETIDWESENGAKLKESLILSEKAKKFAIAQQTFEVTTVEPLINCVALALVCPLNFMSCYVLQWINTALRKHRSARYVVYGLVSSFFACVFFFIKDNVRLGIEEQSDERLADFGREYIEGGLEFYEKLLAMNSSLAQMKKGSSYSTYFGNVKVSRVICNF